MQVKTNFLYNSIDILIQRCFNILVTITQTYLIFKPSSLHIIYSLTPTPIQFTTHTYTTPHNRCIGHVHLFYQHYNNTIITCIYNQLNVHLAILLNTPHTSGGGGGIINRNWYRGVVNEYSNSVPFLYRTNIFSIGKSFPIVMILIKN